MWRGIVLAVGVLALPQVGWAAEKVAPSKIVNVTVYPNSALVTREVEVPEGAGALELVVTPLPPQTIAGSLYSEGTDGIRILTTRYRMRPIQEDTREEVRKIEAQIKKLHGELQKLQSEIGVAEKNLQMLAKLEDFTGATLKTLTEKGMLNAEATIALSKYVMEGRADKAQTLVNLQQKVQDNQEQTGFAHRKLRDLTAGTSKTERDAVIYVDKKEAAGKIKLNYLVDSSSWRPQYKLRADKKENKPVQVEYLAAVIQQTGEEWGNVNISLSTAQPRLNAMPPDLKVLEVAVLPRDGKGSDMNPMMGGMGGMIGPGNSIDPMTNQRLNLEAQKLRGQYGQQGGQQGQQGQQQQQGQQGQQGQQQQQFGKSGGDILNEAAALEQTGDLLASVEEFKKAKGVRVGEGPSITYSLAGKLSIPSRHDEQIIEITKLELMPDYFYKAVPILTPHVYRLANLENKTQYVLLPGEATMYIGTDFVGRADLPLVAIGEKFTAGFGVDPQLQVQRQLADKSRTTQGDNQVWTYHYRILVSSYKTEAVKLQLWDRLPHGETEAVGVTLVKSEPKISEDPIYKREKKPSNLLRWDLTIEPGMNGEKAFPVTYEFKLELGRQMMIGNIMAK